MTIAATSRPEESSELDVVIVGAGLAGLTAAVRLLERPLSKVIVLEARERVGGRTLNHEVSPGHVVEAGGEYVGPTQGRIARLAEIFGVETFPAYTTGEDIYVADGIVTPYNPKVDLLPPPLKHFESIIGELDAMSEEIAPSEPWKATNAELWDSQTVQTWLSEKFPTEAAQAIEFVELFFNSAFGGRAMDVSLLFALTQIAGFGDENNKGSLVRGISGEGGAQESRIVGGSQIVSLRIWEAIKPLVVFNAPVRKIEQNGGTVTVISEGGGTWTAKRAIVAVPPPFAVEIEWQPLLPAAHDALRRRMALGTLAKCMAIYAEPFWRNKGMSGFGLKLGGTVKEMFDNTPSNGSPGVLNGFVGGHAWRTWQGLSPQQREAAVIKEFAEAFGPEAEKNIGYFEQDWTQERWTRGCPVSALETGVTTDFLPIMAEPFGLVHWAGTETAEYWNGFMDGAVRSGERAVEEIPEGD